MSLHPCSVFNGQILEGNIITALNFFFFALEYSASDYCKNCSEILCFYSKQPGLRKGRLSAAVRRVVKVIAHKFFSSSHDELCLSGTCWPHAKLLSRSIRNLHFTLAYISLVFTYSMTERQHASGVFVVSLLVEQDRFGCGVILDKWMVATFFVVVCA